MGPPRTIWDADGTSRCPFVPGQKYFLLLLSLCPGTRAGAKIPGQTALSRTSRNKITFPPKQKTHKKTDLRQKKDVLKQEKDILKQEHYVLKQKIWSFYLKIFNSFCPGTFAPALVLGQRDTGTRFFFVPGQREVPSQFVPGRPVSWKP